MASACQLDDEVGFLAKPKPWNVPSRPPWNSFLSIVDMVERGVPGKAYIAAVNDFEARISSTLISDVVADVPRLDVDEVRWLYSTFTFVCQKYVHGDPPAVRDVLPECIGFPWSLLSAARGAPMAMTYDALVIGNWRLKDSSKAATIDNMDACLVVRGTEPEKGFALVHMAMEASAGSWPARMLTLHEVLLTTTDRPSALHAFLEECARRIAMLSRIFGCMWKMCEHPDYWNVVRATLMGYPESSFPDGLRVRNHPDINAERKGGTGAQSPLMHAVDTFLGIDHKDDVNMNVDRRKPTNQHFDDRSQRIQRAIREQLQLPAHALSFFAEQKHFMCVAHRDYFFRRLDMRPTLRDLVMCYGDLECAKQYNTCIELLTKMRKVHQNIAHKYIAEKAVALELDHAPLQGGGVHIAGTVSGVGGSNFVSLLNQVIAETAQAALDLSRHKNSTRDTSKWRLLFATLSFPLPFFN